MEITIPGDITRGTRHWYVARNEKTTVLLPLFCVLRVLCVCCLLYCCSIIPMWDATDQEFEKKNKEHRQQRPSSSETILLKILLPRGPAPSASLPVLNRIKFSSQSMLRSSSSSPRHSTPPERETQNSTHTYT